MGDIVSFVSPTSGIGTSTLARAFAVEAAHGLDTILVDLDLLRRSTLEWGERRAASRVQPALPVEILPHLDILAKAADVELLVVDAPAGDEVVALWLVQNSVVTIVPMRDSIDGLSDTLRFLDGLTARGVAHWRFAVALSRLQGAPEPTCVREALVKAGYLVLEGEMGVSNSFRALQEGGHAITESPVPYRAHEAYELVKRMQAAYIDARERVGS